jgi:hypothetical protein
MKTINISCSVGNRRCDLVAEKKKLIGMDGYCYWLTRNGEFIGAICKETNGNWQSVEETSLTKDDIDSIGEQIDAVLN